MAEPMYMPVKPQGYNGTTTTTTTTNQSFPPSKAQLYGATGRPVYRPQPKPQRRKRSCCCKCFLWTSMFIITLIVLAALAGGAIYLIYRPHHPVFHLTGLQITQLNVTTTPSRSHLNSDMNITITARNRNKKITYFYDAFTVLAKSNGVYIGNGSFPSFVLGKRNTAMLHALVKGDGRDLESGDATTTLKNDLKKTSGVDMEIVFETKAMVKMGGYKSRKVRIRITCGGVKAVVIKGKVSLGSTSLTSSSDPKCKIDARIKIWKWTF